MKIGIIVYSKTGHTFSVAEKIQEKLNAANHQSVVEQITISGEASPGKFEIVGTPVVDGYDAIVFGAPVQAFSLNPVMDAYLKQLPSLAGKKAAFFVTKQLPLSWTGGNKAIQTMEKTCITKGAETLGSGMAFWKDTKREESVKQCVETICRFF
jgi:NAD(P)H dehydrogenase (quinone)